jgi:hypothetical protein
MTHTYTCIFSDVMTCPTQPNKTPSRKSPQVTRKYLTLDDAAENEE